MPGIYRMSCNTCDYTVEGNMSITTVILDDGSETVCPHPSERAIAERATGRNWRELVENNCLVYRYALVCLSCGELGYYGPTDRTSEFRSSGHIGNIVHQPDKAEASNHTCKACGKRTLYPLCGQIGCLIGLLHLFGLFREQIQCPACQNGYLSTKMIGRS